MPNIGSLQLKNNLVCAPLAGISDYSFRQLARDFGIGLSYTEMISAIGVYKNSSKCRSFSFISGEHPVSTQIFGKDPISMAYAAKFFEDKGADVIDINFGCPVKKVVKQGAGAVLMKDITLCQHIIKAVRKAISIPLTIKIRLGWSAAEENYLQLARIAQLEGVDAICLHPRYATQLFSGSADWSKFIDLRKITTLKLIGSGDIKTSSEITAHNVKYPVDFIMLGRGLMGNPWLISDCLKLTSISLQDTLRKHYGYLLNLFPEKKASNLFRKFVGKYTKNLSNAKELRSIGNSISCANDFSKLLEAINV